MNFERGIHTKSCVVELTLLLEVGAQVRVLKQVDGSFERLPHICAEEREERVTKTNSLGKEDSSSHLRCA